MTQLEDIKKAIHQLAQLNPDKAREQNEIGPSKIDTEEVHILDKQKEPWRERQIKRAIKICEKYRKQFPVELRAKLDPISLDSIQEEESRIAEIKKKTLNSVKVTEHEENVAPKTFKTEDGTNVYLENFKKINPAQDFNDGIAYITQSLWYDKPNFDNKGNFLGTTKEQGIIVIMSNKKTLRIAKGKNQYGNLLMDIPDTAPENRFSIEAINKFLKENIDFDPWDSFTLARTQYQKHIDFENIPGAYSVSAIYDYLSYFTPLFETVPYFWNTGDMNAGKTKDCSIHEKIGFNGFLAVGLTAPSLFRTIRDTKGMIAIDESEDQGNIKNGTDEDRQAREQIINSGYKKTGKTTRTEREGPNLVRVVYPTYSTKVIGGIRNVSDTIRSRSYKFLLLRTNNHEIANSVISDSDPVWQEIRDRFYITMLNHWTEIEELIKSKNVSNRHTFNDDKEIKELILIGRDWEKAEPILTIAQWLSGYCKEKEDLINEVWEFLRYQREIEEEASLETLDSVIIAKVEEIFKKDGSPIELKRISNLIAQDEGIDTESSKFNLSKYSHFIKTHLQKVGIAQNFKPRGQNRLFFDTSSELIAATKQRYKINVTNVTNHDNQDNLDNLTNLDNLLDRVLNDFSTITITDNLTITNQKLASMREKLSRLSRLSSSVRVTDGGNNFSKDDLINKTKDYLSTHDGIVAISKFYEVVSKEWYPNVEADKIHELMEEIKEGFGIKIDYSTQYVSLTEGHA